METIKRKFELGENKMIAPYPTISKHSKFKGIEKVENGLEKLEESYYKKKLQLEREIGFWWGMVVMGIMAIIIYGAVFLGGLGGC